MLSNIVSQNRLPGGETAGIGSNEEDAGPAGEVAHPTAGHFEAGKPGDFATVEPIPEVTAAVDGIKYHQIAEPRQQSLRSGHRSVRQAVLAR